MAIAYAAAGLCALAVFAVPLLLMRKTQESYLAAHARSTQQAARRGRDDPGAERLARAGEPAAPERSTAAMESLSATVDARDAYTAGHSRRVQQLALAIGRELGLSQAELDLLGYAALFHDIGKLAIPDAILLKPATPRPTTSGRSSRATPEEGAPIIDRLGFLDDAVPAIRHHHERFDGRGYPDRLDGRGDPARRADHPRRRRARLDAHDAHLPRRRARLEEALAELERMAGHASSARAASRPSSVCSSASDVAIARRRPSRPSRSQVPSPRVDA